MCKKIHKTIIFSTYLPNLEALWYEIALVFTVFALLCVIGPHWPAPAVHKLQGGQNRRLSTKQVLLRPSVVLKISKGAFFKTSICLFDIK